MQPCEFFRHCPRCGAPRTPPQPGQTFTCAGCGFRLYFNPAVATAAVIEDRAGRILCFRRAREPQRGKLAFPGGFIDIGESAESALRREIKEEVGLDVGDLEFLCSAPNEYPYDDIIYPVVDFLFRTRVLDTASLRLQPAEAEGAQWLLPEAIRPDDLAFPSLRMALAIVLGRR